MATANAQRRWQAACPNCGAPVEFASSASASAVCSFCRSTLLREGNILRKIGISAELIEDYSPLQPGAAGRYSGAAFTVIGRLQFGYAEGSWNEWHLLFDSGPDGQKSGWLSEDNGSFVLSFDTRLDEGLPRAHELVLGAQQVLAGEAWSVAALTTAQVLAAQGELLRPPVLKREFLIAELRNARDEVGSLDYSDADLPQWSLGRPVRIAELAMTGLREDGSSSSKTVAARALPCPGCGAPLEAKLASTQSIVCGHCQAVVDLSQGVGADLAHYAQQNGMEPQLPMGGIALLAVTVGKPLRWQIVGYQERCDLPDGGDDDTENEQTFWREYLLFNQQEGFAFLVDTDEGWSLVRPLTGAPRASANGVTWQGQTFRRRFRYAAKVTYVLGEFYWRVEREARAEVTDYEPQAGNAVLSSEQTDREITWSHGRKLDAAEVAHAFDLAGGKISGLARDTAPIGSTGSLLRKIAIGVFIVVIGVLMVRSCGDSDDCAQYRDSYGEASAEYAQCKQRSGGGRIYPGGGGNYGGGSYGGYSGGSGGHK